MIILVRVCKKTVTLCFAVYEYPDYVQLMAYPFVLKVACTTSLQDELVKAAKNGFCPASSSSGGGGNKPCVFEFVASCFDSTDPQVIVRLIHL